MGEALLCYLPPECYVPFWDRVRKMSWIQEGPPEFTRIVLYRDWMGDESASAPWLPVRQATTADSPDQPNARFWEMVKKYYVGVEIPPGTTKFVFHVDRTVPVEQQQVTTTVADRNLGEPRRRPTKKMRRE